MLKLRIPGWAVGEGVRVEVNGEPWDSCAAAAQHLAGSFCTVRRTFAAGVVLQRLLAYLPRLPNVLWRNCVLCVQAMLCIWSCQCPSAQSACRMTAQSTPPCTWAVLPSLALCLPFACPQTT